MIDGGLLKSPLFPYQAEAIEFHYSKRYSINGFQMGLGKSVIALGLCEKVGGRTLIVCPAYLRFHWRNEIAKFTWRAGTYDVVSYNALGEVVGNFDVIVFDEAHYLKNPKANRTKFAHNLVNGVKPKFMLCLTGTPIKNKVIEWWSLLRLCTYGNAVFAEKFKPFQLNPRTFGVTFSYERVRKFGGIATVDYTGVKNPDELRALVSHVYTRRKSEGLPEKMYKTVRVDSGELLSEDLKRDFEAVNNLSSAKRINARIKVPATINLITEHLDEGKRVVVFTDHVESCELIAEAFKVLPLSGAIPGDVRAQAVADFEAGKKKVIVGTIGSMSTGHSIISTNYMIFNDYPWVPADLLQSEGRIQRITQKEKTCFYTYVFSSEIDEMIYKTLKAKTKVINLAT